MLGREAHAVMMRTVSPEALGSTNVPCTPYSNALATAVQYGALDHFPLFTRNAEAASGRFSHHN